MGEKKLERERALALRRSIELGERLQKDMPEIASDYRSRMTQKEIVEYRKIIERYPDENYSFREAIVGVSKALRGHEGTHGSPTYDGLIPENEMDEIGSRNNYERSKEERRERGINNYKRGIACFSISQEERKKIAGKVGRENRRKGRGIFGMTHEQRQNAARNSLIKQGKHPLVNEKRYVPGLDYCLSEKDAIILMAHNREYKLGNRANAKKMADDLNQIFHDGKEVRTPRKIARLLYNITVKPIK